MNRFGQFFLLILAPALALVLGVLGAETISTNPLGWFLLLVGVAYIVGVVVVFWIRKERFWESKAGGALVHEERNDRSFWLIALGMLVVFYFSPVEYLHLPAGLPRNGWMNLAGVLLVIPGCGLFVWARRSLNKNYSGHLSVTANQELVQSGAYRLIRHPAYAGYLLMALGLSLGFSSLGGLAGWLLLLLPGMIYRIHVEEKILTARFGEQYRNYAARTARLIPGLW